MICDCFCFDSLILASYLPNPTFKYVKICWRIKCKIISCLYLNCITNWILHEMYQYNTVTLFYMVLSFLINLQIWIFLTSMRLKTLWHFRNIYIYYRYITFSSATHFSYDILLAYQIYIRLYLIFCFGLKKIKSLMILKIFVHIFGGGFVDIWGNRVVLKAIGHIEAETK